MNKDGSVQPSMPELSHGDSSDVSQPQKLLVLVVSKGVLSGHESPLVLFTCYLLGPRKIPWPCGNSAQSASWAPGLCQASPALPSAAPASARGPGPIRLAALFPL